MWTMLAPASKARRTSFAYSSGVYGMPGHCRLSATAPETAHVMMQGSSTAIASPQLEGRAAEDTIRPTSAGAEGSHR